MHNIKINEDKYLLVSLVCACRLKNDTLHTRLPIRKGMLGILIDNIEESYNDQPYLSLLYQTLLCTTYYGLFRVGEVTSGLHAVLAKDVQIATNKKKMLFILRSSKMHGKNSTPQLIKVSAVARTGHSSNTESNRNKYCPFSLLNNYAQASGNFRTESETFFIFRDHSPVTPRHMRSCLKKALKNAGFNHNLYRTHSLCAGRTCDLYKLGLSVETIKKLGRWRSNAVFRYLRGTWMNI